MFEKRVEKVVSQGSTSDPDVPAFQQRDINVHSSGPTSSSNPFFILWGQKERPVRPQEVRPVRVSAERRSSQTSQTSQLFVLTDQRPDQHLSPNSVCFVFFRQ